MIIQSPKLALNDWSFTMATLPGLAISISTQQSGIDHELNLFDSSAFLSVKRQPTTMDNFPRVLRSLSMDTISKCPQAKFSSPPLLVDHHSAMPIISPLILDRLMP